jgi:glycosyltransferase involved in cell wall biosynthesis
MSILLAASLYPPETRGPATFAKQLVDHLEAHNVRVTVVPFYDVRALPPGLRHLVYFFKLLLRGGGTSTVLALDAVSAGLPALFAARLRGARLVLRLGGDYAWEQGVVRFSVRDTLDEFVMRKSEELPFPVRIMGSLQDYVATHADRVVVPSEYLKRIVVQWGVAPKKITVIHSAGAAPRSSLAREDVRQRVGWGEDPVVFSAGALVPWKGFPVLIDAVALLRKEIPKLRLVIAGQGPERQKLWEHARSRGFDPDAVIAGELPQTMMLELLQVADVFALNTGYEGLSHQVIEVMQAGVPIVTTPVGGNPELIEHEKTGLFVEHDNCEALAGALRELLTNKKKARSLAALAKAKAATLTPEVSMRAWEKVLKV